MDLLHSKRTRQRECSQQMQLLAEDTLQNTKESNLELLKQQEQLQHTEHILDEQSRILRVSAYLARGIQSRIGYIQNLFVSPMSCIWSYGAAITNPRRSFNQYWYKQADIQPKVIKYRDSIENRYDVFIEPINTDLRQIERIRNTELAQSCSLIQLNDTIMTIKQEQLALSVQLDRSDAAISRIQQKQENNANRVQKLSKILV